MSPFKLKPGVEEIPPGTPHFYRLSNSWAMALKVGAMTVGAIALANLLAVSGKNFDTSVRNISRCSKMSRSAVQNAMDNLVHLGLADPVMNGNHCFGYRVYLGRTPKVVGLKTGPSIALGDGTENGPSMAWKPDQDGMDSVPLYKEPEDSSSLRSSERIASLRSGASAKPVATITTASDGQVGFGFADDQGVLSELDILKVMTDIRKEDIGGDPEDHELRAMITGRIAFMTSPTFKGHPLVKGGKETAQANRDKVKSFCMRIISKSEFRWASKRVDPVHRDRVETIKRQIADLMRKTETYQLKDGSVVSPSTYSQIMLDLQTHRDQMIEDRIKVRPKAIPSRDWRQKLEERITLELVAKHIYGDAADAHLPADEDRMEYRRQISVLRSELAMMG